LLGSHGIFLRLEGGLLLGWINLDQGRSGGHAAARMHKDLGNHPFDLRHDYGSIARLQGGDVLRGVVYRDQLGGFDLHRDPGRPLRLSPARRASTACGAENGHRQDDSQTRFLK
jgi:hypothetical protein